MKRRDFITASSVAVALLPKIVNSQEIEPAAPRDWSGNTPLRYPDPDLVALDNRFQRYILFNTINHVSARCGLKAQHGTAPGVFWLERYP